MACVKDAMRTAVQRGSPRLVEAMLRCQVQCSMEQLGNMHGVISKRRGQVLREDLWEGTYVFTVECIMPVRAACCAPARARGGSSPPHRGLDPCRWRRALASRRNCA